MANVHVLQKSGSEVTVACHVAVPAGNNAGGVPWQTALINSGLGGTTILKDGDGTGGTISAAEKAAIVAGTLVEVIDTVRADTVPLAGVNAYLDGQFTRISGETLTRLQQTLRFFGATR